MVGITVADGPKIESSFWAIALNTATVLRKCIHVANISIVRYRFQLGDEPTGNVISLIPEKCIVLIPYQIRCPMAEPAFAIIAAYM